MALFLSLYLVFWGPPLAVEYVNLKAPPVIPLLINIPTLFLFALIIMCVMMHHGREMLRRALFWRHTAGLRRLQKWIVLRIKQLSIKASRLEIILCSWDLDVLLCRGIAKDSCRIESKDFDVGNLTLCFWKRQIEIVWKEWNLRLSCWTFNGNVAANKPVRIAI